MMVRKGRYRRICLSKDLYWRGKVSKWCEKDSLMLEIGVGGEMIEVVERSLKQMVTSGRRGERKEIR